MIDFFALMAVALLAAGFFGWCDGYCNGWRDRGARRRCTPPRAHQPRHLASHVRVLADPDRAWSVGMDRLTTIDLTPGVRTALRPRLAEAIRRAMPHSTDEECDEASEMILDTLTVTRTLLEDPR